MFMLPLSNCWRNELRMKAICLSCLFWVPLAAQLSKSTQSGASEQRGQNDYLAFSFFPSCCLIHINPLIHCYILLQCLRAVDMSFWELLYPVASSRQTLPCLICCLKHSFMNFGIHCYTGLKSPVDVLPLRGGLGRASWMFRTRG